MKQIIIDINLNLPFDEIRNMKKREFMKRVDLNLNTHAFQYLKKKIKSKGKEINNDIWYCQDYLLPNDLLTYNDQVTIFSYRSRMNKIYMNFKNDYNFDNFTCICNF